MFERITLFVKFLIISKITRTDHSPYTLEKIKHRVTQRKELLDAVLVQRYEAVVNVFLARVADSPEAVQHVLAAVDAEMEPCVLLDCHILVNSPEAQHFLTSGLFKFHTLLPQPGHGFLKLAQILRHETVCHLEIRIIRKLKEFRTACGHVCREQAKCFGAVF